MIYNISFDLEKKYLQDGYRLIAGIDEAGRGPIAGPVFAAAVILDQNYKFKYLNDSKTLSNKKMKLALEEVKKGALYIGVGYVNNIDIDKINILRATRLAMNLAVKNLKIKPDILLVDGMGLDSEIENVGLIKGDKISYSIAAASVVAKTTRDLYMKEMDKLYPYYSFSKNMGYPTKGHLAAIMKYGITPIHRLTFKPIKDIVDASKQGTLF